VIAKRVGIFRQTPPEIDLQKKLGNALPKNEKIKQPLKTEKKKKHFLWKMESGMGI